MPYYLIRCGGWEVVKRARDSETAVRRFRAKYTGCEPFCAYTCRVDAPRGANQAHEEPPKRIRKTDVKPPRVDDQKIEAEKQEAGS